MFERRDFIIMLSPLKNKKYRAFMKDVDGYVDFGAIKKDGTPYEQYRDTTSLKYYKDYDHNDKERQENYIKRHKNDIIKGFNAGWLSYLFLWS